MSNVNSAKFIPLVGLALIGCAAAGFFLANKWLQDETPAMDNGDYSATVLSQPRPLPPVELVDKNGQPWRPQAATAGWQMMFFGFTHCPDICPITLTVMKQLDRRLKDKLPSDLNMVFVSVDPQRDDVTTLREYVEYFDPDFQALTGDMAQIEKLTSGLYLPFSHTPDDSTAGYRVDHSAALVLINPDGAAVAYLTPPHDVDKLSRAIRQIIQKRT